jgi:hypothetical protein
MRSQNGGFKNNRTYALGDSSLSLDEAKGFSHPSACWLEGGNFAKY